MKNNWLKELQQVLVLLLLCAAVGWIFDALLHGLLVGGGIYIIWNFYQLHRLHRWLLLDDHQQAPPELSGFWGAVCDKIYYLQRHQQRITHKLEADVAYLRSSFASLTDAVIMVDKNGNISWCNDAAMHNLGLRLPDDLGQHLLHLFRDPIFVQYLEAEDFSEGLEIQSPIDANRILWLQVTLFGKGNRLIFGRDITEVHKLELMRRDFVSNVSHELRTPLTVINGYIDNFHHFVEKNPAMEKPLQQMAQHAQRMENLLRDLIDLSRLETLPNEINRSPVSLSDLSHCIIDEATASLGEQRRQISADIDEGVMVAGNSVELHSALLNLLVNACKYTPQNGKIHLRCYKDEKCAYFSVTDNGIGIDPQHIPRLTERFYRVDPSRSMNTGGTGLGLAIVKHVLLRHNGELHISSSPNKGSTFSCHFCIDHLPAQ